MAKIIRVEVYVDGAPEPLQVLTQEPFKVNLDPAAFEEGDHFLRVTVEYDNGDYHEYLYTFTVAHRNEEFVGYLNRAPVRAPVDVLLIDPMERAETAQPPKPFIHGVLPVLLFLLVAGIATWFAIRGDQPAALAVAQVEDLAGAYTGSAAQPAQPQKAASADGKAIYQTNCASCHGPEGQGMGDVFPALAGNPNLADTEMVLDVVVNGRPGTAMPAWGGQLSDEEIAAVINYVLSSWGNDFGSVTPEDVARFRR